MALNELAVIPLATVKNRLLVLRPVPTACLHAPSATLAAVADDGSWMMVVLSVAVILRSYLNFKGGDFSRLCVYRGFKFLDGFDEHWNKHTVFYAFDSI